LVNVQLQREKLDILGPLVCLLRVVRAYGVQVSRHDTVAVKGEGLQEPVVELHVMVLPQRG
jgi:hypothetical protein